MVSLVVQVPRVFGIKLRLRSLRRELLQSLLVFFFMCLYFFLIRIFFARKNPNHISKQLFFLSFVNPKQFAVRGPQFFLKRCPPLFYWRCPALLVSPFICLPSIVWGLRSIYGGVIFKHQVLLENRYKDDWGKFCQTF